MNSDEIQIDKNLSLKVYILSNPNCSFQKPPSMTWFEFHKSIPIRNISSIISLSESKTPITAGIPSIILLNFKKKDNKLSNITINLSTNIGSIIKSVSKPISCELEKEIIEIPQISKKKGFFTTIKYLSNIFGQTVININGTYSIDSKLILFESKILFDVSIPFEYQTFLAPVQTEGLLLQINLINMTSYILHNVRLEINSSSNYHINEPEVLICEKSFPQEIFSTVFGLELLPNFIDNNNILNYLCIKWSLPFEENCEFKIINPITLNKNKNIFIQKPILISLIGSPQMQLLNKPFNIKLDIHNTSKISRKFQIKILSNIENKLIPNGLNIFQTDLLNPNQSQRIDVSFVGFKQGLLLYPEFIIESLPDLNDFLYSLDNGVLILEKFPSL